MFVLCDIRARSVYQRRVLGNDPVETRFFKAPKYRVSPILSKYRRQNASVPNSLCMVLSNFYCRYAKARVPCQSSSYSASILRLLERTCKCVKKITRQLNTRRKKDVPVQGGSAYIGIHVCPYGLQNAKYYETEKKM